MFGYIDLFLFWFYLQVPPQEILPPDVPKESPRSVPLPPPIIPETEESTPSPVSEASSGYISTSISTVTLSDVYTLSWDLPSASSTFEAVTDAAEEETTGAQSLFFPDSKAAEESTDWTLSEPQGSGSNQSQQEPENESDPQEEADSPCQTGLKQDPEVDEPGPEDCEDLELINPYPLSTQKSEPQTSELLTDPPQTETPSAELHPETTDQTEPEPPVHHDTQESAQGGQEESEAAIMEPDQAQEDPETSESVQDPAPSVTSDQVLLPAPEDPVPPAAPEEKLSPEDSDPESPSIQTSSTSQEPASESTDTTSGPGLSLSAVKPSAANPFKIQKVKSSDLKSFQEIVGEEEEGGPKADRASSLGSGLNLSVPMENLEIISDSEEGDGTAVLPEWMKEGEFVTVGTNKSGTIRYIGPTDFAKGTWVGVELEVPAGESNSFIDVFEFAVSHSDLIYRPVGKNDGSVGGKHYFHCNPGYGVLVRPHRVSQGGVKRRRKTQQHQQKRRSANLSGSSPNLAALTALAKGEGGGGVSSRSQGDVRKSWNT